jgi:hypothetical protein
VRRFDHDADPARAESRIEPIRDLPGQSFLGLRSSRKHLDDSREFRQPENSRVWDVTNMCHSGEGQHVVLAY